MQSQGQGEQLFTIVKNQSKDKRKIEIQQNLQRKRENSMSMRNNQQYETNVNNLTADDQVMLATNSTLEQMNVGDSISVVNTKTPQNNASVIIGKGGGTKQAGGKKFQLKAVDVGNIYKSLKLGQ